MPNELLEYVRTTHVGELSRDLLDVLITYYVFYRVALVLKGTRAMQVVVGLVLVFVLYVVAELLRLRTVLTLLQAVLSSAILIGVVVFQGDIRRGLMRVGARARFGAGQNPHGKVIDAIVEAATTLARHRTGALITLEQDANLDEFVGMHTGHRLDAAVSPELLVSLFIPEAMNKLHDGAVIIRDLRVAKAGVFFPMPEGRISDASFGSRHRAAMGITEETDAIVIVVSEERGSISFCFNGNIISNLDGPRLRAALEGVFAPKRANQRRRWFSLHRPERAQTSKPQQAPARSKSPPPAAPLPPTRPVEVHDKLEDVEPPRTERSPSPLRKSKDDDAPSTVMTPETSDEVKPLRKRTNAEESPQPLRKRTERNSDRPPADPTATPATLDEAPAPLRRRQTEGAGGTIPTPLRHMAVAPEVKVLPPDSPATTSEPSRPMPRAEEPPSSVRPAIENKPSGEPKSSTEVSEARQESTPN